ncbi:hypothetical protein [Zavarzinia sp.]|uniref:hypothetical protein n=1 Tax=Zavarzinia sp. TaxID=2027920 RepID=UPI00356745D1
MAAKPSLPGKSWGLMLFSCATGAAKIAAPVGQAVATWKGWRAPPADDGRAAGLALLLSIFWEESLFNNIAQTGSGTAVGFGQVEPAEMYKFDAANVDSADAGMREAVKSAQMNGYLVYNLPKRVKNGNQTILQGRLTDFDAAIVSAAALRHVYEVKGRRAQTALEAYAGIGFTGGQVPAHLATDADRRAIIDGWLACAKDLYEQGLTDEKASPDAVMGALNKARAFNDVLRASYRPILFPGR